MERDLGVSYRTAWYLNHRIRKSMEEGTGLFTGVVEADETFIGGRYDRRRKRGPYEKTTVFGALQRGTNGETSKVRAFPVRRASAKVLSDAVQSTVSRKALLVTDEHRGYINVGKLYKGHESVKHIALEYVRKGDKTIHTNSIENFWSLFKRGVIGQYHQVSAKHLHRYLDEFTFRFNNREAANLFALVLINLAIKQGIQYKELTAKASGPELL